MDYRYENPQRALIRVTDGDLVWFVPADQGNKVFRVLTEGVPENVALGFSAIAPVTIIDPFLEN